MTNKKNERDLINEIMLIQARNGFQTRHEYWYRLHEIERALNRLLDKDPVPDIAIFTANRELLRYIPIAIIACIQNFFRLSIKELIDSGEPFNKNVSNFKDTLSYDILAAIQTKTFTLGEFIAHSLSYSNLEQINSHITNLIDENFIDKLQSFERYSLHEPDNLLRDYFKKNSAEILESINIAFKMRHTFCHENATNVNVEPVEIKKHFDNCKIFILYSNEVITNILHPNYPQTQQQMNQESFRSFEEKDKESSDLIEKIKLIREESIFPEDDDDCSKFDEIHEKWKEYRKLYAELSTSKTRKGTIHPLMYNSAMERITTDLLQSLKERYRIHLKKGVEFFSFRGNY
jgi:hypothetical protein